MEAQSTQDPAWKKYSPCCCLGGLQRLVLKGATDREGFCPVYSHPVLGMGVGVRGTEAFANFLAEIITDQTILSSPPQ